MSAKLTKGGRYCHGLAVTEGSPRIAEGHFTQADTHWNTANMIYGDNPQKIYELKNYNWARYSSSQIHSVIKKFVEQASRYVQIAHIGGNAVNGVIFYFSSKPPQEVIEALLKIGVSVQWVSTEQ